MCANGICYYIANMSITIRTATPSDAGLIADMSRQTFYDSFAPDNSKENMDIFMNEVFTRDALIDEVGAEGNTFFLAYLDTEPVGYARMREGKNPGIGEGKPSIEIARIYAVQTAIGKGVGSALMQSCVDIAAQLRKEFIYLGVWENNKRAIDFYSKWGFEKYGTHVFMLGKDAQTDWLMWKSLATHDF